MILEPEDGDYAAAFIKEHEREFSFTLPNRKVLVENLRVRGRANAGNHIGKKQTISSEMSALTQAVIPETTQSLKVYFEGGWTDAPLFVLKDCVPGTAIKGPAMIYDSTQMVVVQPGATAKTLQSHIVIDLSSEAPVAKQEDLAEPVTEDPIELSIMSNRYVI